MNGIASVAASVVIAALYVIVIHAWTPTTLQGSSRDDAALITHRLRRVSGLCVVLLAVVPSILVYEDPSTSLTGVYELMGVLIPRKDVVDTFSAPLRCLSASLVLFSGPIFAYIVETPTKYWSHDFQQSFYSLQGFRNHVFAPITEELVYRSIVFVVLSKQFPTTTIILYSPLLFGLAHAHHGYDLVVHQGVSVAMAVSSVTFQTLYTSLFGVLAGYVFERYNSMWCAAILHAVCNVMGIPPITVHGSVVAKFVYYLLLPLGVYGFINMI
ncbi:Abi-domain-containing protein [Yamadazyma tenuis ATCC 10573]|uniref:intramembrane prenyl-peptidase Rce1 n=1 Tax=Candida tenuis (strain ATCC 10573 / BCRC 21748 / CBS 615 / JCM 9827 / NBRC 10315 / NRRL Y-1498 / VKM Y-70) TaxID=590646 RepID=G3BCG7_CANTC|nr:Abi-domain-containing protein [Yamadazyma tenuis ATCC 10573]EGV60831.1 Abi-domain-containing protein [Yamadazyma tenuis ATCC 10573]